MATPRQRAAQIRNFGKMRLSGVQAQLLNLKNSPILSELDKKVLAVALHKIDMVLRTWNKDYVKKLTDKECKSIAKKGY